MTLISRRRILWLAAAGCLLVVLLLLRSRPEQSPQPPDLLIVGQPQMTNGAMLINIIVSNGTSTKLNIIDDTIGNPFMVLDAGAKSNMPGTIGFGLSSLANSLKLNLTPGATLTNIVRLTNPPSQFRILVEAQDLDWERRRAFMEGLKFLAAKASFRQPPPYDPILLVRSPWITNGNISNITETAAGPLKETPTNSLSQ